MANELRITVCHARPDGIWTRELILPAGATLADAVAASGFGEDFPDIDPWQHGVGVYGRRGQAQTPLACGDRVEIYRPLTFDPKESRRRRAEHRRLAAGRSRPAGLL